MSSYRALAASFVTAALVPLLAVAPSNALVVADTASSAGSTATQQSSQKTSFQSLKRKKAQAARLSVLPKIAQKGKGAASADKAKAIGEVKFSPAKEGRKVQIYRSSDGGTTWTKWGSPKKQNDDGVVRFTPAAPLTGAHWTYRAEAAKAGSLAKFMSGTATDQWTQIFEDQFGGASLNSALWSTRGTSYDKGSQRKCSKASPKMAKVGSGVLSLKVKKDPNRRGDVCKWKKPGTSKKFKFPYYLNAHVGTDAKFTFRYGTAAARVKFQQPRGMHGSFWMNTSDEPQGRRQVEIDTVEFFGKGYKDGGLAQFLHYKGRKIGGVQKSADTTLKGTDNWWKKYHVFSVVWSPSGYSFRIDGTETFRTSKAISDKQVLTILSLLSSDWELADMPKSGKGSMKVDWVRVWQHQSLAARNLQ
jgi:beta-glucanase (GH16 family)